MQTLETLLCLWDDLHDNVVTATEMSSLDSNSASLDLIEFSQWFLGGFELETNPVIT